MKQEETLDEAEKSMAFKAFKKTEVVESDSSEFDDDACLTSQRF